MQPRRLPLRARPTLPAHAPPQDLARAGQAPIVLHDCLKWLARFALTAPNLFSTAADKRKLLGLRQLYDSGKRPLRSKAAGKDPILVGRTGLGGEGRGRAG